MARKSKKNLSSAGNLNEVATTRKGKKEKKKKKKKKHPVAFGIFLFTFCCFVSVMLTGIVVGGSFLNYIDSVINGTSAIDLDAYKSSQSQTSFIYAYNDAGEAVEQRRLHGEENRIWVDYDEIPLNLQWAFVCLEDKRFYEHPGVDWIRTIGVFINPAYEGQGASTITQQLIKNLTDQNEATYMRKFHEILKAINFERNYSKKDILEAYLNTASLGAGCYGVKTAAETYFAKELSELTLSECATIAGITQAPYSLNPYVDYEACMFRRDECLEYMYEQGKITTKQYQQALAEEIVVEEYEIYDQNEEIKDEDIYSWYEEYLIDQVIEDLQDKYNLDYNEAWQRVYYGGLNIYSAVDLDAQETIEYIYENRVGFPDAGLDSNGDEVQSSMTVMDYNGRIIAIAGGADKKEANRGFNRATDEMGKRQPGSSIKPLAIYGPAFDKGLLESGRSTVLDKAITVDGEEWPQNYNGDHGSGENLEVEKALAQSLNTVPARIIDEMLGLTTSFEYCTEVFHLKLGEGDRNYSSMVTGGTETGVTTLEMAAAYAVFGNGGYYFKPYSYYKVTDRNGAVILDNTKNMPERAISEDAADKMLDIMFSTITQTYGTGYGYGVSGFDTFAKTGTTSNNYDKWFCGGTPHYVTAVWLGFDVPDDTDTAESDKVFSSVFEELHEELDDKEFSEVKEETAIYIASINEDEE